MAWVAWLKSSDAPTIAASENLVVAIAAPFEKELPSPFCHKCGDLVMRHDATIERRIVFSVGHCSNAGLTQDKGDVKHLTQAACGGCQPEEGRPMKASGRWTTTSVLSWAGAAPLEKWSQVSQESNGALPVPTTRQVLRQVPRPVFELAAEIFENTQECSAKNYAPLIPRNQFVTGIAASNVSAIFAGKPFAARIERSTVASQK